MIWNNFGYASIYDFIVVPKVRHLEIALKESFWNDHSVFLVDLFGREYVWTHL